MKRSEKPMEKRIVTIPNLLSLFRLLLIPVIIYVYIFAQRYVLAALLVVLSGLTDVIDGRIARHFHMVSDVGRILDPIADKLTQFAVLVCLCTRFPAMKIPIVLLVVKECVDGILGLLVVRRTGSVYSAEWHGKLATVLLYVMMFLHIFWPGIPMVVSSILIVICVAAMLLSLCMYSWRNLQVLRHTEKQGKNSPEPPDGQH